MAEEVRPRPDQFLFEDRIAFGFRSGLDEVEGHDVLVDFVFHLGPIEGRAGGRMQGLHGLLMGLCEAGYQSGRSGVNS